MPFNLSPSKTIRVNEDEIYYYYGQTDEDGRRNGYGRTAMKNGHTAYDGTYTGDLRNGFGVYYYRNGKVCYVGDWKNNHKHLHQGFLKIHNICQSPQSPTKDIFIVTRNKNIVKYKKYSYT